MEEHSSIISQTKAWIKNFVIQLNLCPFAAVPFREDRIRYVVSEATEIEELAHQLSQELNLIQQKGVDEVETTLIIHPYILKNFEDYIDFVAVSTWLLEKMKLEGILQIASFHPNYQFAGVEAKDVSNYTNRSPYPMLHILREDSVTEAVDNSPDTEAIPERNIALLQKMGLEKVQEILQDKDIKS